MAPFEAIPCPLCGQAEFDVIKPAAYSGNETADDLRRAYSASSSHRLLDRVVRCTECGLHYVNPRPDPNLITEGYAEAADRTFVAQNPARIRTFSRILRKVLASHRLRDGDGLRFLDIGCAGGACLEAARSLGFDPVGVEPSRWLAEFGRQSYGVEIHEGLLQQGMFARASFDWITLWDVLEHVPEPKPLLDLIASLLRAGGIFIVSYPDFRSAMGRLLGKHWPFWLSVHLLYYDRKTIASQLARSGFEVERMLPYWMTLELGYVAERAAAGLPALGMAPAGLKKAGLGRIPLLYNMGQTIVIARKI